MEPEALLKQLRDTMQKAIEYMLSEFSTLRTDKAAPSIVENLKVESYGTLMKLKDLAAITTPDARTLFIQPWDKGVIKSIQGALQKANLGFNPLVKETGIFCHMPELSQERRKQLVAHCQQLSEQTKVRLRAARKDAMDGIKALEKSKLLSEDERKIWEKQIQDKIDSFTKTVQEEFSFKEKDLLG